LHFFLDTVLEEVFAHLFVKVPRPGDNKVIFSEFESSCHLLLSV